MEKVHDAKKPHTGKDTALIDQIKHSSAVSDDQVNNNAIKWKPLPFSVQFVCDGCGGVTDNGVQVDHDLHDHQRHQLTDHGI